MQPLVTPEQWKALKQITFLFVTLALPIALLARGLVRPRMSPEKWRDCKRLILLIVLVGAPSWFAVTSVTPFRPMVSVAGNPSPLGYFKSLGIFLVPCAYWLWWFFKQKDWNRERKAFWITFGGLTAVAFGLDIFFGRSFLTFENKAAVILLPGPGLDWSKGLRHGWGWCIPGEEFVFYISGFLTILLCYLWSDEEMFRAYKVDEKASLPKAVLDAWWKNLGLWMGAGVVLVAIVFWFKKSSLSDYPLGFPGYFTFLLFTAILPCAICFPLAFGFVNWRALTFTYFFILAISIFWEALLGVPYQWWGYQNAQMMGVLFKAYSDLPLEAVLVWSFATFTTVFVYEALHVGGCDKNPVRTLFARSEKRDEARENARHYHRHRPKPNDATQAQ